jgi:hypothetical protein
MENLCAQHKFPSGYFFPKLQPLELAYCIKTKSIDSF